ncbi:hypothetical protein BDW71DRAFT_171840 [Aspergillus fruticulosus]
MHDEHQELITRLEEVGNRVEGCVLEGVTRDIFAGGPILRCTVEARNAMQKARDLLDRL